MTSVAVVVGGELVAVGVPGAGVILGAVVGVKVGTGVEVGVGV